MSRLNQLVLLLLSSILLLGTLLLIPPKQPKVLDTSFDSVLKEAQDFYKSEVGYNVRTPIKPFDYSVYGPGMSDNVLAYCYLNPNNTYIAFNHARIEQALLESPNPDFVFQIILHEYTHCEGGVGHVEMFNHFMNDGGAPWLTKAQVKDQFKDYLKYYRTFYKKFPVYGKDELDLNTVYALTIEKDSEGNIKTSCTCSVCTGVKSW